MVQRAKSRRKPRAEEALFELPESLRLADVGEVHARMQALGAPPPALHVSGAAVREVDTAGLQLLCAFVQEARRGGSEVVWHEPAGALRDAATRLGLEHCLGLAA